MLQEIASAHGIYFKLFSIEEKEEEAIIEAFDESNSLADTWIH